MDSVCINCSLAIQKLPPRFMLTGRHSIIPIKQHVLKIWAHFKTILLTIIVPQYDTVIEEPTLKAKV